MNLASKHIIEVRLALNPWDEIRCDFVILYIPGDPPRIEIEQIILLGHPPPIAPADLKKLGENWLDTGGYDTACNIAEEQRGGA